VADVGSDPGAPLGLAASRTPAGAARCCVTRRD
jgi:hypothetical protein